MFFEKYTQTILGIISTRMAGEASAVTRLLDMIQILNVKYIYN